VGDASMATILFTDLVDSTALSVREAPEREIIEVRANVQAITFR
jgi:class 3 adenylate cyclase